MPSTTVANASVYNGSSTITFETASSSNEFDIFAGTFSGTHVINMAGGLVYVNNNGGGTVTFGGNLTINGNFQASGGTIMPGNGAEPGVIQVNGNIQYLSIAGTSYLDYYLGPAGTTGGGVNDLISATGTIKLAYYTQRTYVKIYPVPGFASTAVNTYALITSPHSQRHQRR